MRRVMGAVSGRSDARATGRKAERKAADGERRAAMVMNWVCSSCAGVEMVAGLLLRLVKLAARQAACELLLGACRELIRASPFVTPAWQLRP